MTNTTNTEATRNDAGMMMAQELDLSLLQEIAEAAARRAEWSAGLGDRIAAERFAALDHAIQMVRLTARGG